MFKVFKTGLHEKHVSMARKKKKKQKKHRNNKIARVPT